MKWLERREAGFEEFKAMITFWGNFTVQEGQGHGFLDALWVVHRIKFLCEFERIHPVLKHYKGWADTSTRSNIVVPNWSSWDNFSVESVRIQRRPRSDSLNDEEQ